MIWRNLAKDIILCTFLITALFYVTLSDTFATPCVVSLANDATIDYYEIEINGVLYEFYSGDPEFKIDVEDLADGTYEISVTPVNENGKPAPVYFTLHKFTDKNKSYYQIVPDEGYEQRFAEPLVMVINNKAGKAVGGF